ncbi:hypothetical protein KEM56_001992, partial [Ascosphaera pollenicola]
VNLNLTPEEKRQYYRLFQIADETNLGVITGEVAVSFFERTGLPSDILGQIWQMADTENRGLLTPTGFGIVMRLIGHAQAGRPLSEELALQPGPLPRFTGLEDAVAAPPPAAPSSKAAIAPPPAAVAAAAPSPGAPGPTARVPPLNQDEMTKFLTLFERSDPQNGLLPGDQAKQIFERSHLPNETLGQIWTLVDTQSRGCLDQAEFIIAMHLLTAARSGGMPAVPAVLPPGLYDAAARFAAGHVAGGVPQQPAVRTGSAAGYRPLTAVSAAQPVRVQSPISKTFGVTSTLSPQATGTSVPLRGNSISSAAGGLEWLITPVLKQQFDAIFGSIDKTNSGFISGDQAVGFFSRANLDENTLAQIWDLADIDSDGQLNRDEFAVAMYLIRQQRAGKDPLPVALPPALIPPSMRHIAAPAAVPIPAPAPAPAAAVPPPPAPKSAAEDLFGLDVFSQQAPAPSTPGAHPPAAAVQIPQGTGSSNTFSATSPKAPVSRSGIAPETPTPAAPGSGLPGVQSTFKPFVPTSSFGQSLTPQYTGQSARAGPAAGPVSAASPVPVYQAPAPVSSPTPAPAGLGADDLLGDADPEESKKLTGETTELANLSNQIGTLSREMQNVQNKRASAEQELSQSSAQKRNFEARLAQARTMYQKEVDDFKALEERLKTSRADTGRKQAEYAIVEGQRADLQNQFNTMSAALEADVAENTSLKEKIKAVNAEIAALKPQLEKLKSDARQQKGLVAINKKQLATLEAERDKLNTEMATTAKELDDAQKEFREQTHLLSERNTPTPAAAASGTPMSPASGMNPFFRRTTNPERGMTQSPAQYGSPAPPSTDGEHPAGTPQLPSITPQEKESLFDDVFGPMPAKPGTPTAQPPPTTSFRNASGSISAAPSPALGAQSPQPPLSREVTGTRAISPLPDQQQVATGQESVPAGHHGAADATSLSPPPPLRTDTDFIARDLPGSFPDMASPAVAPIGQSPAPHEQLADDKENNEFDDAFAASGIHQSAQKSAEDDIGEASKTFPPIGDLAGSHGQGLGKELTAAFPSAAAHTQPADRNIGELPPLHQIERDDDDESSSDEEGPEEIPGYKPEYHAEAAEPKMEHGEFPSAAAHTLPVLEGAQPAAATNTEQGASASAPPSSQSPIPPTAAIPTPPAPALSQSSTAPGAEAFPAPVPAC